ncbi:hypothetical protein BH09PSE4_BH09PSE4_01880 [soil metagenome]
MKTLTRLLAAFLLSLAWLSPANAAVTITFWSHELGKSFPHAFFTLRGVPDAGGAPVDLTYGFTPTAISPAMLFGNVKGKLDIAKPGYIRSSDAQFSMVITDAQFADIMALVHEWGEVDTTYNMNHRNCVSFTQEAARLLGLPNVDFPKLIKKPRSFMKAVAAANPGRVTIVDEHGDAYLASLPPLAATSISVRFNPITTPPPVPAAVNY